MKQRVDGASAVSHPSSENATDGEMILCRCWQRIKFTFRSQIYQRIIKKEY